jgi:hypothetical protein
MPLPNRVTPLGELVAVRDRGLVYGNRGCLHDAEGQIRRSHAVKRWIACRLEFGGRRRRPLMAPGRYTELFFLDEVTALAAGHRPCAECRREDYNRFRELIGASLGADQLDALLHAERLRADGSRRLHEASSETLPDGTFVLHDGRPHLVLGNRLLCWTAAGYAARRRRPAGLIAGVITPPSLVALLAAGWEPLVPLVHPSAKPRRAGG